MLSNPDFDGSNLKARNGARPYAFPCSNRAFTVEGSDAMARFLLTCMLFFLTDAVKAEDLALLRPGEYEVQMKLELPHIEDMGVMKTSRICIRKEGTHGIVVLSENNPLVRCPASNIHQTGNELKFDIICQGHNQAVAWASFELGPEHFAGAFDMKMGGKNMTMTERQTGKRVGDCAEQPHS